MDIKGDLGEETDQLMTRGSFLEEVGLVDNLLAICPKCSFNIPFVVPPPSIIKHCEKCGQLVSLPRINPIPSMRRVSLIRDSASMSRSSALRNVAENKNKRGMREQKLTAISSKDYNRGEDSKDRSEDGVDVASKAAQEEKNEKLIGFIRNNDSHMVRSFLTHEKVNPNIPDSTSVASYPLHWCACSDRDGSHLEILEELLTNKHNPARCDVTNKKGQTPAMLAAANGNIRVLQMLHAAGANFTIRTTQGFNVVHFAAQNGHTLLLDFFKRTCHMSLDELDKDGRTALHWATYNGHRRTVEWLIKVGECDIMCADDEQCLPIHWAALQGNIRMANILLQRGDVLKQLRSKECNGKTPCDLAREKANRVDAQKAKLFKRLSKELEQTEVHGQRLKLCGRRRMVNWSCAGGVGSYFFWFLAIFEWSISYSLYYSEGMIDTTGHRWMSTMMFFVGSVWQVSSWYLTVSSDPGYVLDKKSRKKISSKHKPAAAWKVLKELYRNAMEDVSVTDLSLDETDGIVRPLRSKHCAASGRTVLRFDHFCPWMNNCIGGKNYIWFVSFLTATIFLSLSWVILGCTHLRVKFPDNTSLWQCILDDPFRAFWYLHYGMYFVYSILLCQQHYYLIAVNLTTNEQINKRRYDYLKDSTGAFHNPYDQGALKNFIDFFRGSEQTALPPRKIIEPSEDMNV